MIVGTLDAVVWLLAAAGTFLSQSDPATKGLDTLAGIVVTALYLFTGAPALFLAWRSVRLRFAFALTVAFPVAFAVLFIGTVIGLH